MPDLREWKFSQNPEFIFYCDNETIHGVEFPSEFSKELSARGTLVCDMSSNILSRKINIRDYGCIFAGI